MSLYEDDYYSDYMEEKTRPSGVLITLTVIPLLFNVATYMITDGFNTHPPFPPIVYAIATLIILILAIVLAIFAYILSKDEEPEWGSKVPYKIIQALNVASIIIAVTFIILVIFVYYLS